jgi:hypothetical protein
MDIPARLRIALTLGGGVGTLLACGGGRAASDRAALAAGPPSEAVALLRVAETPDRIVYTAPVSLAKPPDTTGHGRKLRR